MIQGRTIICVASSYDADPTSKHHVMRRLAGGNTVLWVSYHGTRRPRINVADFRLAASAVGRAIRGARRVDRSLTHFTPIVLPGAGDGPAGRLNHRMVRAQIRRALRRIPGAMSQPIQLWSFAPDAGFLAGAFGEECVVYYCVDEFAEFDGVDSDAIRAAERRLMRRTDVVFTTSRALHETKSELHDNVHFVPHGVDVEHFGRALNPHASRPADAANWSGKVIGFFGLVHKWVDVALIAQVARRLPNFQVVIIGDVLVDVGELRALPNVHLPGRKPYEALPEYCAAFDVGIIPFKCGELTRNVNPIKLREYLAAGLPVVSTPLPEVQTYAPEVTTANGADAFAAACEAAAVRNTPADRARRNRLVAGETWDAVVDKISRLVPRSASARPPRPVPTVSSQPSPVAAH